MGNIAYNSFKRDMSDGDFTKALEEIVKDRFGERVVVQTTIHNGELCSWIVGPKEELIGEGAWAYQWEVYRESKRKFGGKHPPSLWGDWFMNVIQNELAYRHNGRISDEGVSGTWCGDPTKSYLISFREYLKSMWKNCYQRYGEGFIDEEMEQVPEALRGI